MMFIGLLTFPIVFTLFIVFLFWQRHKTKKREMIKTYRFLMAAKNTDFFEYDKALLLTQIPKTFSNKSNVLKAYKEFSECKNSLNWNPYDEDILYNKLLSQISIAINAKVKIEILPN